MQLPPIPSSLRTSAAATGAGLHLAADARALKSAAVNAPRVCAECGRPAELPPPPAVETPIP